MTTAPRFQHIETFPRNGRIVAQIRDTLVNEDMWIHRQGQTLLHWNKRDRLVTNGLLRREARSALDAYAEKRLEEIGQPCRRCGDPFDPIHNAKTCPRCLSEIGKANGLLAHREAA